MYMATMPTSDASAVTMMQRLLWVPTTSDVALREHGRFVAALSLSSLPPLLLIGLIAVPLWLDPAHPLQTVTFRAGLLMMLATIVTYVVNRRGHCRSAATIF